MADSKAAESSPTAEKPSFFSYENIKSLVILIVIVLALRWSVASPYHVPTASMEPTIKVGDRLLAFKLSYDLKLPFTDIVLLSWGEVEHGDIIVFRYPKDTNLDYVKRVIGLAGDKIQIIDDTIYINGEAQSRVDHNQDRSILTDIEDSKDKKLLFREKLAGQEHWAMLNIPQFRPFAKSNWPPNGGTFVVPENSVFVMGDNRDNSTDSRIWGVVPLSYVRGKALFVIWSVYSPEDSNWPKFRFDRFGHVLDG